MNIKASFEGNGAHSNTRQHLTLGHLLRRGEISNSLDTLLHDCHALSIYYN